MSDSIIQSACDLAWSLFTELGVPGVIRRHQQLVLDPEPLLIAAPFIARTDARLRDEMFRWCAAHSDRISASRLSALLRKAPPTVAAEFTSFSATLASNTSVKWPVRGSAPVWGRAPGLKTYALDPWRPALLRFRIRALAGVGARADVIAELLRLDGALMTASDLTFLGYSKRNISRILEELSEAGIARKAQLGNRSMFGLAGPEAWGPLVHCDGLLWTWWRPVFDLVSLALELVDLQNKSEPVRRVEATKTWARVNEIAFFLDLPRPDDVKGVADAWTNLTQWLDLELKALALGASKAIRPAATHLLNRDPIQGGST